MSNFKKHVGRIRNTDRRCVVVYMQIPGNDDSALIVDTDALPDRFHDALMDVIDSTEGQQETHLHKLLARRVMPDMGTDMMNAFHSQGLLRPMDIDNVVMFPAPNAPCPLRTIVDYINGNPEEKAEMGQLENRILENQKADASQSQIDIAQNMLQQAQDLENSANAKREQAYRIVPHLRPQVTDSQEVTEASESADGESDEYLDEHRAANEGMVIPSDPEEASVAVADAPVDESAPAPEYDFVVNDSPEAASEPLVPGPVYTLNPGDVVEDLHDNFRTSDEPLPTQTELNGVDKEVFEDDDDGAEYDDKGNRVDTSDEAVQAFLDRVAHRADLADKELQESLKPKQPVGRPRNDGKPAGTKVEAPAPEPKKRGRPPKAKK